MIMKIISIKQKNLCFIIDILLTFQLFYNNANNQCIVKKQLTTHYFFVNNTFMYLC